MEAEKGIHDIAVDILKERLNDARAILKERYKGVRPFRQPKIPDREIYFNYAKLSDVEKMFYKQSFGEAWDMYESRMMKLEEKYRVGGNL